MKPNSVEDTRAWVQPDFPSVRQPSRGKMKRSRSRQDSGSWMYNAGNVSSRLVLAPVMPSFP